MAAANSSEPNSRAYLPTRAYMWPSRRRCHPRVTTPCVASPPARLTYENVIAESLLMDCIDLPLGIVLQTGLMNSSANAVICAPAPPQAESGFQDYGAIGDKALLSGLNLASGYAVPFSALALGALVSAFWYRRKYQGTLAEHQHTQ